MKKKTKKDYCVYDCEIDTKLKMEKNSRILRVKAYLEGTDPKANSLWDVERACITSVCKDLGIRKSQIEKVYLIHHSFWGWVNTYEPDKYYW
jgi:hypothetical protein